MSELAPAAAGSISCVVADDHPAVVQAVVDVLDAAGIRVTGSARDGQEAARLVEESRPSVALLDVRMPRLSGIDVARRLAESAPDTAVILYTAFGDRALLSEALDAGARGFVLKEAPLAEVVRAIHLVSGGRTYVDPVLAGVLSSSATAGKMAALTQRERDVLRLLADGLSNDEIGKQLFISAETVRSHVRKAMAKLDADTRTQAVATALRQSLIA
jgi:DNA-binding NarL/FixJ family response regulator